MMSEEEPVKGPGAQLWIFDFTLWVEHVPSAAAVAAALPQIAKKWVFQKELCPTTEKPHWQGRVSLHKKKRFRELLNLLRKSVTTLTHGHWSPTSTNSSSKFDYCMKADSRAPGESGPWSDEAPPIRLPRDIEGLVLYPWQQTIVDSIKTYDSQHIDVVYDPTGCTGKSTVAKYIECHRLGAGVDTNLDTAEKVGGFAHGAENTACFVFDVPRATRLTNAYWSTMESIKNGVLRDWRYKGRTKMIDPPRVWVFTNTLPNFKALTRDRWRFWSIDKTSNQLVEYKLTTDITAEGEPPVTMGDVSFSV